MIKGGTFALDRRLAVVACSSLLLAGCGGSNSPDTTSTEATSPSATATSPAPLNGPSAAPSSESCEYLLTAALTKYASRVLTIDEVLSIVKAPRQDDVRELLRSVDDGLRTGEITADQAPTLVGRFYVDACVDDLGSGGAATGVDSGAQGADPNRVFAERVHARFDGAGCLGADFNMGFQTAMAEGGPFKGNITDRCLKVLKQLRTLAEQSLPGLRAGSQYRRYAEQLVAVPLDKCGTRYTESSSQGCSQAIADAGRPIASITQNEDH